MKAELTAGGVLALAGLAVLALAGLYVYSKRGAIAATATAAVDAVNPASSNNLVNRGVTAAGAAVTGDSSWTLGGQLAEWFDPTTRAANNMLRTPPFNPSAGAGLALPDVGPEPYSPFMVGA